MIDQQEIFPHRPKSQLSLKSASNEMHLFIYLELVTYVCGIQLNTLVCYLYHRIISAEIHCQLKVI